MNIKRMMVIAAMAAIAQGVGFCSSAYAAEVTNTVARQRYPWNGLVDITCKVSGIEGTTNGLKLAVAAVMPDAGNTRNVSHVWLVQGGTSSTDREVHVNGNYQLLWDARADLGTVRYTNMVVLVTVDAREKVQLWEGGPYWATTNIGAEEPEDYGYYFWWGDTVGYTREGDGWEFSEDGSSSNYCGSVWVATDGSSSDFQFSGDPVSQQTYGKSIPTLQSEGWVVSRDGTYVLAPEHDAAQVQWGGGWRMPTYRELSDLNGKCDWTWTLTTNGVSGYVVRGRGDYAANSIFLPCAGYGDGTSLGLSGQVGNYWSSVPDSENDEGMMSDDSYYFYFYWDYRNTSYYGYRFNGYSVRPVQDGVPSALAGDSAPFPIDTMDGTRLAREVETITYSPHWNDASECSVAVNGNRLLATAEEGSIPWPCPATPGCYAFTHTAGGETLTARFAVLDEGTITIDGDRLQSNATWTADKTWLITTALTVPSGVSLLIERGAVVKFMPGASLTVESGGSCTAKGVVFTHVNDDTVGGDTLFDGDATAAKVGEYNITGNITGDDFTEYRYAPTLEFGGDIFSDRRLLGNRTYIVFKSVTVASGATLTLPPGTILKFDTGCSLTVNGTLDAQGTRAAPIVFTSLKDDEHGGDANGDGDKTYAQAGNWHQITGNGTVKLNYCEVLWCSAQNNQGALYPRGGTWQFDNSIVAHCQYDCMRSNGGTFTAKNSVFMDSSMGAATRGAATATFINCVFNYLTTAVRWGNGRFYNCIFNDISQDIIDTKFYSETLSSRFYNCCFWNPNSTGDHASAKVGQNGCFYADPLFVDAANGDFRIAANSPCVDAGDGTVAPETDYWGQPRMDVKAVKNTGTPNGDGACPDIGIYEVPGTAGVQLPDLAVVSADVNVGAPDMVAPGHALTVTYVVTNRGAVAATGLVRDLFHFKGADAATGGITVDAAEIEQAYNIAAGASAEFSATVTVPTLKAGKWKVLVAVNADNYPYEQNLANNSALSETAVDVELEAMANGTRSVTVGKGEVAGFVLSGLPLSGGVVRVTGVVTAYGGNGAVPAGGSRSVATVPLADGSLLIVYPARAEGENAYLVLENGGNAAATVSVEVKEPEFALYDATPRYIANAGEATITITGSGLADITAITLGGRKAKSVEVLNAAQIAATFDVEGMWRGDAA